ncbi:hypothetical protein [Pararhizobium haloflavum]|uniref:hypothetical protein n=1 Tax=Pararhizobium haloflavum TaxID=2037914 RepID=UPI0012FFE89E|nr:hypothetical protein [Pararhizobium haloflavum]
MVPISAHSSVDRHYYKVMTACLALIAILLGATLVASEPFARFLLSEGGPIETVSAAGYIVTVISLFREADLGFLKEHFHLVLLPLAMCLREMDFHVHFTTISITKSSFYVSGEVPLIEKIVVISILLVLLLAVVQMVRRHARAFLQNLREFDATAIAIMLAGACAVTAKALDGIGRKLSGFGIEVGANVEVVSLAAEEVLELGIPVFFMVALFSYFARDDGAAMHKRRG